MVSRVARCAVVAVMLVMLSGSVDTAYAAPFWPGYTTNGLCAPVQAVPNEVECRDGGVIYTSLPAEYTSPQVLISVNGGGSAGLYVKCTDQGGTSSMLISNDGDWTMDCPTQSGANQVDLELDAPNGGLFTLTNISYASGGAIYLPTATATNTPTPGGATNTPTATVPPGSTSTPLPTHTPLPSSHVTYTPTGTSIPATATATSTTAGDYDCGDNSFPLLNCNFNGGGGGAAPHFWTLNPSGSNFFGSSPLQCAAALAYNNGAGFVPPDNTWGTEYQNNGGYCYQSVTAQASGTLFVDFRWHNGDATGTEPCLFLETSPGGTVLSHFCNDNYSYSASSYTTINSWVGVSNAVSSGTTYTIAINDPGSLHTQFSIIDIGVSTALGTVTPLPTATPSPSPSASVSPTQIALPFDTATPFISPTPCPLACAGEVATEVPAIDTVIGIDTDPISPLLHLSLARTGCQKFFDAPVVIPQIHGTPVFGSSQPLSITWTTPATGTAFQPCADPNFNSEWWDIGWNMSVVAAATAFIAWIILWVRRLFS